MMITPGADEPTLVSLDVGRKRVFACTLEWLGWRRTASTEAGCAGWLAHPWLKARDRAVDTAPGHRASARCDQAASVGGSWRL